MVGLDSKVTCYSIQGGRRPQRIATKGDEEIGLVEFAELDAEAARVVKSMPKWKPATVKDKAVRCRYTVPVTFKLQ